MVHTALQLWKLSCAHLIKTALIMLHPLLQIKITSYQTHRKPRRLAVFLQLLKLSCAHLIKTPFYFITDADTFYLNPFSAGSFLTKF